MNVEFARIIIAKITECGESGWSVPDEDSDSDWDKDYLSRYLADVVGSARTWTRLRSNGCVILKKGRWYANKETIDKFWNEFDELED